MGFDSFDSFGDSLEGATFGAPEVPSLEEADSDAAVAEAGRTVQERTEARTSATFAAMDKGARRDIAQFGSQPSVVRAEAPTRDQGTQEFTFTSAPSDSRTSFALSEEQEVSTEEAKKGNLDRVDAESVLASARERAGGDPERTADFFRGGIRKKRKTTEKGFDTSTSIALTKPGDSVKEKKEVTEEIEAKMSKKKEGDPQGRTNREYFSAEILAARDLPDGEREERIAELKKELGEEFEGKDVEVLYAQFGRGIDNGTFDRIDQLKLFEIGAQDDFEGLSAALDSNDPNAVDDFFRNSDNPEIRKRYEKLLEKKAMRARVMAREAREAAHAFAGRLSSPLSEQAQETITEMEEASGSSELLAELKENIFAENDKGIYTKFLGAVTFIPFDDINNARIDGVGVESFSGEEFQRTLIDKRTRLTRTFKNEADREAFVEGLLGRQLEDANVLEVSNLEKITGIVRSLNLDTPQGKKLILEIGAFPLPQNEYKLDMVATQLEVWGVGGGDGVKDPTTVDTVIKWWRHQEYMWREGGKTEPQITLLRRPALLDGINADGSPKPQSYEEPEAT